MAEDTPRMAKNAGKPRRKARGSGLGRIMFVLVLVIGVVFAISLYVQQESQMARIRERAAESDALHAIAQAKNEDAHRTLDSVGTDSYIERIARDQLGMVKPGERVFKTVE